MDSYNYGDSSVLFPFSGLFFFEDGSMSEYVNSLDDATKTAVLNRKNEFHSRSDVEEFVRGLKG